MATQTLGFAAAVSEWVAKTKQRQDAVFRESAERVIEDMQSRVPVDTGFLRASLQISKTAPAPLNADRPATGGPYTYEPTAAVLAIAGAQIGDTLYASYTARYAAHVNYGTSKMQGRQFVGLAAQRWPSIVSSVCSEIESRIK